MPAAGIPRSRKRDRSVRFVILAVRKRLENFMTLLPGKRNSETDA